jgi:hypothetical protein
MRKRVRRCCILDGGLRFICVYMHQVLMCIGYIFKKHAAHLPHMLTIHLQIMYSHRRES